MHNPWDINKLSASQILSISDFLADYAANEAGQAFTFTYSLYDDPDDLRQMFYLRATMDNTTFAQSKQILAPDLPDNEVIGFIIADLIRQLELSAYHTSLGQLGLLSEPEVVDVVEPEAVGILFEVAVVTLLRAETIEPATVGIPLMVTAATLL